MPEVGRELALGSVLRADLDSPPMQLPRTSESSTDTIVPCVRMMIADTLSDTVTNGRKRKPADASDEML